MFFVGAALGKVLGRLHGLPLDLVAGVGLAATFAVIASGGPTSRQATAAFILPGELHVSVQRIAC